MFLRACLGLLLLIVCFSHGFQDVVSSVNRGAQVRLTSKGMRYGASIGVQKLQEELKNKAIPSQSGSKGDVSYRAENIIIHYLTVGRYQVQPLPHIGLKLSVNDVFVSAQGKVSFKYQKGWWIYNLFSTVLENKLEDVLKTILCREGKNLIDKELNKFLTKFPVTQNIENWAIIDYSFEKPVVEQNYIDLMLRGEFLNVNNPVRGGIIPPKLNTITSSEKMAYVWISDFTLNSAGKVFHEAGLLRKHISPLIANELIPAGVQPFLNTRSFEQIIPELFKRYPNRPIQFDLQTNQAPTFDIDTNKIDVLLFVKAIINVIHPNKTSTPIFYIDINVKAAGSVKISKANEQLIVGGNIASFSFSAAVGGSIIGEVLIPFDNQSIKDLVHGLVIEQANPILNKGFPIPKIKNLDFENPTVTMVKDAIRVDTNIFYSG